MPYHMSAWKIHISIFYSKYRFKVTMHAVPHEIDTYLLLFGLNIFDVCFLSCTCLRLQIYIISIQYHILHAVYGCQEKYATAYEWSVHYQIHASIPWYRFAYERSAHYYSDASVSQQTHIFYLLPQSTGYLCASYIPQHRSSGPFHPPRKWSTIWFLFAFCFLSLAFLLVLL